MASTNDITGDTIISRVNSKAFDENFDRIFNNPHIQKQQGVEFLKHQFHLCPLCGEVECKRDK
jgi:16S rRNA G1207 methylase RsmC